jgi:outer membrane receptor protein involved in Fe transport
MRIVAVRENTASLALWDFKVSKADLFALPGGDIGMAAGLELRSEKYEDNRDTRQDTSTKYRDIVFGTTYGSDLMGHSPSPDVKGDRKVTSAYVEFGIPIVSPEMDIPLMESIDLQIAGRYEDYNDIGDVAKPKVAASWDIIEGLRIRGSWSEGFKAPNLEVLNIPLLERLNGRNDYIKCEADLRARRIASYANCTQNYGVPGLRQGNAALVPEESESFSYGFVFEPMFIPDQFGSIILTVDRWNIQQTGIVGVLDEQSAMNLDYLARLSGGTNPLVGRAAPTPAEVASFAGTGLAPAGEVLYVNAAFTNLRPLEVGGVDFGLVYQNEFGELGDLTMNLNVTKLEDFFQEADPQQQILLDAKTSGVINAGVPLTGFSDLIAQAGNPEIKWTLSATWSRGPMQVGFMTQYTDDVIQPTVLDAARNPWEVDSLQTYNLYAQYSLSGFLGGESSVRIGARNLTDEQPPLASGGYLGNLHQPQGRYSYASVRHSF